MSFSQYQLPYQNQLQFNLDVPLTTNNLAAHFQHPRPIFVERISGQHAIPGKIPSRKEGKDDPGGQAGHNYSVLSEDKMEMMSQLARRDLRNRKLQAENGKIVGGESHSPTASPSRAHLYKKTSCSRLTRDQGNRSKHPLRAREAERNRRLGAVQTPPPRKPVPRSTYADDSFVSTRNTSLDLSRDADVYFPVKPFVPEGSEPAKEDIVRLQQELEGYLRLIGHVQERAIADGNTKFLHLPAKGKSKDGFLDQIEDLDRARARVTEQNIRSARNTYNLRQKVKQLQRDLAHADLNKPQKKNQILAQVNSVHRGAVKSLQTFVNQLPHQDLSSGLPSHYQELSLLLRQLTALNALTQQGKQLHGKCELLTLLDNIDTSNAKWCCKQQKQKNPVEDKNDMKGASRPWVSDTKVAKEFGQPKMRQFSVPQSKKAPVTKQIVSRGRPTMRAVGKENRRVADNERRAMLKAGVAALVGPRPRSRSVEERAGGQSGMAWEVDMRSQPELPDHTKGYLLPSDLRAKRERAQRAVEISNQRRQFAAELRSPGRAPPHFAESTISAALKASPGRPTSAPASPKRKEVNFDLEEKSPVPWIPAGSGSGKRKPRSRSLSPGYSPFYIRDLDRDDVRNVFPGHRSLRTGDTERKGAVQDYGYRSLPSHNQLRSNQVSDSLLDDLEARLYNRLAGVEETSSHYPPAGKMWQRDDSTIDLTDGEFEDSGDLDITDLADPGEGLRREAVSMMDAPTLENVKLRLAEMQREQREIRQRWSTLKFTETKRSSQRFTQSEVRNEEPLPPPAIEVTRMTRSERPVQLQGPVNKDWVEEPLLFTKSSAVTRVQFHHTVTGGAKNDLGLQRSLVVPGGCRAKKLLTMKQTAVERIAADRDRYESYLRKHSHHPTGKFDPWMLMEEISDEIFSECLQEVAGEVEQINEEIANHMYKSEFMVDKSQSESIMPEPSYFPLEQPVAEEENFFPVQETRSDGIMKERAESIHHRLQTQQEEEARKVFMDKGGDRLVGAGDTMALNLDKLSEERDSSVERKLSPERKGGGSSAGQSPVHTGSARPSPNLSAREPFLDDVSQFVSRGHDESGSAGDGADRRLDDGQQEKDDDEYTEETDQQDEDEEDDDDDDDYSDDNFEDVSDVDIG
ncbi:protein moonraker isoform X2 [Aplysia californica]|uniref:Protein moonraker isoform X2 n=1 Tax=Aplysia californica TaxID=6500 RepID=A0ABM0JKY8_APLCA|nr:protein moonraker isoform X2 [Aplysia californica]